jgi:hypothetical protein
MNIFIWVLLVYGIMSIIVRSALFDSYRRWYNNKLNPYLTAKYDWNDPDPLPLPTEESKPNIIFKILNKLISCWLCVTFWTATLLGIYNIGPLACPLADGALAVGCIMLIERYFERFEY